MSEQILEVPTPELIDAGFIADVFEHQEFSEIKTVLNLGDAALGSRFLELGFSFGRQFTKNKKRCVRIKLTRFDYVQNLALAKMRQHGLDESWVFAFDSAKQRAGLCNYTDSVISLSKYIVKHHSIDQSVQVVLHEIAHALAGKSAGHGPNWKSIAKSIGYRGEKFTGKEIAEQTARWIGVCKNGHKHYRFKSPKVQLACGYCGKGFNPKWLITWTERAA